MAELPLDTALATGLESILVAAVLLAVGYLVVDALLGDRAGVPIRLGLAFPGLMAYVLILALIHIGSGGLVFGSPSAIRAGTAALGSALIVRKIFIARRRSKRRSADEPQSHQRFGRRDALLVAGLVALAVALWGSPIVRMIPLGHSGDQTVHMGWAAELMNGETTPSGPLSGAIPNYYPWLFHALVAFIASLTAGGRAFHAQGPLLVVQVTGAVLALYALGRELGGRVTTGAFAAVFGALSGGIGFLLLSRPDFVFDPRENGGEEALRYAGDLLSRRSYNVSFHNLAPTFPRDVAFALTVAFLVMLVRGFRRKSSADFLGAGAVLGMIGLTGGETFIVGVGITIAASVVSIDVGRIRTALATLIPALAVWGLWLVPVAVNYVRLGGFVNTAAEPVTLTPLPFWVPGGS